MKKYVALGVAAGALMGAYAVQAAPLSVPTSSVENGSVVQKVDYRRCSWRGGERRCFWVRSGPRVYGYYAHPRPEAYRTGSTRWWREMDYEGRGGHGRL